MTPARQFRKAKAEAQTRVERLSTEVKSVGCQGQLIGRMTATVLMNEVGQVERFDSPTMWYLVSESLT